MKWSVDERTSMMPIEALACRAEGGRHDYPRLTEVLAAVRLSARSRSVVVDRECRTCKAMQTVEFSLPSMEIVSRRMRYPDGYCMQPEDAGSGRLRSQAARAALAERLLGHA